MNADQLEKIAAFLKALTEITEEYGLGVYGELFDNDKILGRVQITYDVEYKALIDGEVR